MPGRKMDRKNHERLDPRSVVLAGEAVFAPALYGQLAAAQPLLIAAPAGAVAGPPSGAWLAADYASRPQLTLRWGMARARTSTCRGCRPSERSRVPLDPLEAQTALGERDEFGTPAHGLHQRGKCAATLSR